MRVRGFERVRPRVVGYRKATDRANDRVKDGVAHSSLWRVEGAAKAGNTCVSISDKGGSRGIDVRFYMTYIV